MLAEIDDPDRTTLAEALTLCARALHPDARGSQGMQGPP
jgi:hypothetical protein